MSVSNVNRPTCLNHNCNNFCTHSGTRWRPFCSRCHRAGFGQGTLAEGVKAFKTGKCSNADGHLGFYCAMDYDKAPWAIGLTQIDHKDGNYFNNTIDNCDELCDTCHKHKGRLSGDFKIQNKYIMKGGE